MLNGEPSTILMVAAAILGLLLVALAALWPALIDARLQRPAERRPTAHSRHAGRPWWQDPAHLHQPTAALSLLGLVGAVGITVKVVTS